MAADKTGFGRVIGVFQIGKYIPAIFRYRPTRSEPNTLCSGVLSKAASMTALLAFSASLNGSYLPQADRKRV